MGTQLTNEQGLKQLDCFRLLSTPYSVGWNNGEEKSACSHTPSEHMNSRTCKNSR